MSQTKPAEKMRRHFLWQPQYPIGCQLILVLITLSILFPQNAGAQKFRNGIKADYYNGINFDHFVLSRVEKKIGFWREMKSPAKGVGEEYFSIRYSGSIIAPKTGMYTFHVVADDGIRLRVNHMLIVDAWVDQEATPYAGQIVLQKDSIYDLEIEYYNTIVHSIFNVKWEIPYEPFQPFGLQHQPRIVEIPTNVLLPGRSNPKTLIDPEVRLIRKSAEAERPVIAVRQEPVKRNLRASIEDRKVPVNEPIILKTVIFTQQSSVLESKSYHELDQLVKYLQRNGKATIQISGYTDYVGDSLDNQILSEQRAATVAKYLLNAGIPEERIASVGFGSRYPIVVSEKVADRSANRRVEFKIIE